MPSRSRRAIWFLAILLAAAPACAGIRLSEFGQTKAGQRVEQIHLRNELGMEVSSIDYGATITSIVLPARHGKRDNIVLSLPTVAAYETSRVRFGGVMGRYAGRIGHARFTLNGKVIELTPNANGTALHGDPDGVDKRVWQRREFADADSIGVIYHLTSPDGDQRFPGAVEIDVRYRLLRKRNELRIEYRASSDAPTVINLTNHAYFNLAGASSGNLETHRFHILADRYARTDAVRVPDGALLPVAGTPLDFRSRAALAPRLQPSPLLGDPPRIDHGLVFSDTARPLTLVARIDETRTGRRIEIRTTEPSAQLNSGGGFDGKTIGAEGQAYGRGAGFAFETQHLSDSPNHVEFPSTLLVPGQVFHSLTTFSFR
jgi:aldose 1-epimerase